MALVCPTHLFFSVTTVSLSLFSPITSSLPSSFPSSSAPLPLYLSVFSPITSSLLLPLALSLFSSYPPIPPLLPLPFPPLPPPSLSIAVLPLSLPPLSLLSFSFSPLPFPILPIPHLPSPSLSSAPFLLHQGPRGSRSAWQPARKP